MFSLHRCILSRRSSDSRFRFLNPLLTLDVYCTKNFVGINSAWGIKSISTFSGVTRIFHMGCLTSRLPSPETAILRCLQIIAITALVIGGVTPKFLDGPNLRPIGPTFYVQKMHQLWNGIAQNYRDRFWWVLAEIFKSLQNRVYMFQFLCRFAFFINFSSFKADAEK